MKRTNWQRDVASGLRRALERDGTYVDTRTTLNAIANVLRYRDGWTEWSEIYGAIFDEAIAVCKRGRNPNWKWVRDYVWCWGLDHGVITQARAGQALLANHGSRLEEAN